MNVKRKIKKVIPETEWIVTVIHLSAWAQIGVVIRAFLGKFFELGCGGGVYFKDLPANMLGSFIIGLIATSGMVGLDEEKNVAILPAKHPWQSNAPFQTGLRTGLCGSITTFSSWMLEMMTAAIQNNLWMNAIGGIVVGICCAILSYIIGVHCALRIDQSISKRSLLAEKMSFARREAEVAYRISDELKSGMSRDLEELEPDIVANTALSPEELEFARSRSFSEWDEEIGSARERKRRGMTHPEKKSDASNGNNAVDKTSTETAKIETDDGTEEEAWKLQWVDILVAAALTCMTIATSFGVAYETRHTWLRQIWLALIFGPFGCLSRWLLSRLNYSLQGHLSWFPLGTYIANMSGITIDYCLQIAALKGLPGYWGALVINSLELGFCGCLTTVSTLVTEIVKFSDLVPASLRAYSYTAYTFVGAFVCGLVIYGWVFWA